VRSMNFKHKAGFFFRSLLIQGSWNFPRMQGLGFYYAISPWIQKISGDKYKEALRRHMAYFNTHPYMVSYVLGVVAGKEEAGDGEGAVKYRDVLMGPLGAAGDSLFWVSWRPLILVVSLTVFLISPLAGAIFMLVTYNVVHIWARWSLFEQGYNSMADPLSGIVSLDTRSYTRKLSRLMLPAMGFLLGIVIIRSGSPWSAIMTFVTVFVLNRVSKNGYFNAAFMMFIAILLVSLGTRMEVSWFL